MRGVIFLNNALPHKPRSAVKQKKRLSGNAGSTEESCLQIVSKEPADCFSRVPKFLALFASKSAESTTTERMHDNSLRVNVPGDAI